MTFIFILNERIGKMLSDGAKLSFIALFVLKIGRC